jgi:hypothetical protein
MKREENVIAPVHEFNLLDAQPNDVSESQALSTELLTAIIETPDVSSLQYLAHQIRNQESIDDTSVMQERVIVTCKLVESVLRDCTNIEAIKAGRKHLKC